MDIDITRFFRTVEPSDFSASMAELGQNAGKITWNNAVHEAAENPLMTTEDELEEFREYMKGYGAWEDEEIMAWDMDKCNALLVQLVSGDMREGGLENPDEADWLEYEAGEKEGLWNGNIYRGDDGRIYYYVGN